MSKHCAACFDDEANQCAGENPRPMFAPCDCECHHENDRALERATFAGSPHELDA